VSLVVIFAIFVTGCGGVMEWSLSHRRLDSELKALEQADRLDINGGPANLTKLGTVTDLETIHAVVAFYERYPDGWVTFSGAPADYSLLFYKGNQSLGVLGLAAGAPYPGADTLSVGNYFRHAPSTEVSALAHRLNLPWADKSNKERK
jgi:hypothetical protein